MKRQSMFTLRFAPAEKHLIDAAAGSCGWNPSETALFARTLLLQTVEKLFPAKRPKKTFAAKSLRLRA